MQIQVEGTGKIELENSATVADLTQKLSLIAPEQGLGAHVNNQPVDLSHILKDGDTVKIFNFEDPEGKEIFWHTSAHILAQAVLRLWPDAQPTIGPPIQEGFYYDFANLKISDEDFKKIEKEMQRIVKENLISERTQFSSKEEAGEAFKDNPYKCEIIREIEASEGLTAYRQGEFFDLCRGPHLARTGKVKAIKVLRTSGAYWRGDSSNEMLTRIYAITFPDRSLLKDFLQRMEEAKKRDHKILGPRLGLFSLKEEAPGMPFIHPHGMHVWGQLVEHLRECLDRYDYVEIKTPSLMTRTLWEKSGHWENYRENMFTSQIEERDFAIKPMNCPGCLLYYKSDIHSYRELPLRIAEVGNVHRFEPSGAISGLFRVRSFHQDDAHVFLTMDMLQEEILKVLQFADEIYSCFGLTYNLELSTRPEKDTIGTDEEWDMATRGLQGALEAWHKPYRINEGDGAFYGPKIDFHIEDALKRTWQCGTIQLDMALPRRFELEYTAADGQRKTPVMIHRAIYGSIERFFGILIEHFAGRFPLWLSPRQVRVFTVADRHQEYAFSVAKELKEAGFLAQLDDSSESISKKVRSAQMEQVNYMITIGDKELETGQISLRTRENAVFHDVDRSEFIKTICEEKSQKRLTSPYSKSREVCDAGDRG